MRNGIFRTVVGIALPALLITCFCQPQAQAGMVVTTTSLPNVTIFAPSYVNSDGSAVTLQSSGGAAPVTWSISSGSLPAGLSLDPSTGIISGSPTAAAGIASFTVKATGAKGGKAIKALTITTFAPTWMIGEDGIPSLSTDPDFMNVLTLPGQSTPFIILASKKDRDGVFNECGSSPTAFDSNPPAASWPITPVYIYRYTAECQFEVDVAQVAIPSWITWIMYDNELCTNPATPLNEQQDPPYYYTQGATTAHNNGFKFMGTAGLHEAASNSTGACGQPTNPNYNQQDLWNTAGPAGAVSAWDAVDVQTQTGIAYPQGLLQNAMNQLGKAHAANGSIEEFAGIGDLGKYYVGSTQYAGQIDLGTQEEAVQLLLQNGVSGFWGNYGPHPTSGTGDGLCTDPTPGVCPMGAEYYYQLQNGNFSGYGVMMTDFYNDTIEPPTGNYPQTPQ